MPVAIPFLTSDTNYTINCAIGDQLIMFDVRWNSRDSAWYMDMYEADDTIIAINIKIVLGVELGRRFRHDFFTKYRMRAVAATNPGVDPGYDDLNARVQVLITDVNELFG